MHLSSQEEYGVRCLIQVAKHVGEKPLTIQGIANAEGLSPEYAAKLLRMLRQGGLVTSTRGAGGGYRLARPATHITVWDAIQVLGTPLFPESFCASHRGQLDDCVHTSDCSIRVVWTVVEDGLKSVLQRVTLAELTGNASQLEVKFQGVTIRPGVPPTKSVQ